MLGRQEVDSGEGPGGWGQSRRKEAELWASWLLGNDQAVLSLQRDPTRVLAGLWSEWVPPCVQ